MLKSKPGDTRTPYSETYYPVLDSTTFLTPPPTKMPIIKLYTKDSVPLTSQKLFRLNIF